VEQGLKLGGIAGGWVAQHLDQPGRAAGELEGRWPAGAAGAGAMRARQATGGKTDQETGEAPGGAVDAGVERDGDRAEDAELGGDEQGKGREDGGKAAREVVRRMEGVGAGLERDRRRVYGMFHSGMAGSLQRVCLI